MERSSIEQRERFWTAKRKGSRRTGAEAAARAALCRGEGRRGMELVVVVWRIGMVEEQL